VEPERGVRPAVAVEEPFLDHQARAVVALLARLEHEDDPPGQLPTTRREHARGADQHRHVGVVAARVHGAIDLGGERQARLLPQRQRVHIRAQQDRGTRQSPTSVVTTEVVLRPVLICNPRPSSASRTACWVRGSVSPISGWRWRRRRRATTSSNRP
jgi:hypothetical protein